MTDYFEKLKDLKDIFHSFHNGILIVDETGAVVIYNQAAATLLNRTLEELLGMHIGEFCPETWRDLKEILSTGKPKLATKMNIGDTTVIANRNPIIKDHRVIGVLCMLYDLSEYQEMATELELYKHLNKELDGIINSSFDGLWICNHEGRVIRVNRASERLNDVTAEQVVGRKMDELVKDGLIDRSVTHEVLKNSKRVTLIQELKNGKRILVTGNPVLDSEGNISLVVVNERDITGLNRLRNALEESRALAQRYRVEISVLQNHQDYLPHVIIRSESMQRVFNTAVKVAKVNSTVLIQGESGVGKGLLAKIIHESSNRKEGPLIRVDCASIPETLIESELFGYEEGAFTGAKVKGKPGLFELAEGGTLFLDEIGDLPLNVQVKLLRFLEDNEMIRVGGTSSRTIDARVVAATHRDLETQVRKKRFRSDLFFRLNVVPVTIPPLRERPDDIAPLIHHLMEKFNEKCGTKKEISPRAIDAICQYPFPGNIRELSNLIERLVVLSPEERIRVEDLPTGFRTGRDLFSRRDNLNLAEAARNLERDIISEALERYRTQSEAAAHLGIDQGTLSRKIRKHGISVDHILHRED